MMVVRFRDTDCIVEKHHYENGRPALVLTQDGEQVAVATLNLPEIPLGPNAVFIKDYSENKGMLKALVDAGVIQDTHVRAAGGFPIGELLEPYREPDADREPRTLADRQQAAGVMSAHVAPGPESGNGPWPVRDTTRNLVESIWLNVWPRTGAIVDFGLRSQEHYESLYYGVREGEITPAQLDAALGKGEQLTALARSARSNPHHHIEFHTDWDDPLPEPGHAVPDEAGVPEPSYRQKITEASGPATPPAAERKPEIER